MNKKIKCIIVDDEPLSRQVLEKYVRDIPSLDLSASLPDALAALETIRKEDIQLVFLDINMPRLSGLNMVRSLDKPPLIIFTTAYPEYAVEGFELDVVDYLVKPFGFERFLKAVNKAHERIDHLNKKSENNDLSFISIKADKKIYKIDLAELLYAEAMGDYLKLHCTDRIITAHSTMKQMIEQLPEEQFIRVHRSYLVNLKQMDFMEGNYLSIRGNHIPVGSSFKEGLLKKISPGS